MEQEEKDEFLHYLEALTPEYRYKLLQRMRRNFKSGVRHKTKKFMEEHNIEFNECAMCGDKTYIEIHHIDYDKPYIVSPLCMKCHRRQHSKDKRKIIIINLEEFIKWKDM